MEAYWKNNRGFSLIELLTVCRNYYYCCRNGIFFLYTIMLKIQGLTERQKTYLPLSGGARQASITNRETRRVVLELTSPGN